MNPFCKTFLFIGFTLFQINGLQAQTLENLDQVKLMKQFEGNWKGELGKDTIVVGTNTVFGAGLVCNSQVLVKGKVINSVKQLYGYDQKADKFIVAELIETSPVIEISKVWFTSKTSGELIVTNPENQPLNYRFEFKSADLIVQKAVLDNKVVREITLKRGRNKK